MNEPKRSPARDSRGYLLLLGEVFGRRGGIETFSRCLLRALAETTDAPCTAVLLNDAKVASEPAFRHFRLIASARTRFRWIWKLRFGVFAVREYLRLRPRWVVCGHVSFLPVCLLLRLLGARYVVMTYGIEAWELNGLLVKRGMASATKVIAISRYTRDSVVTQVPAVAGHTAILHPTFDSERFVAGPRSNELAGKFQLNGNRVLLTVGRVGRSDAYKGYEVVLRALPRILQESANVKYMVVGSGDLIPDLERLARQLGVSERVIFAGSVPDSELAAYYNLADAFVMPSSREGFGIVFLEALGCGKPVMAGNQDGSADALLDGRLGVLVDPSDEKAVADAVLQVLLKQVAPHLTDPDQLQKASRENFGYERFRSRVKEVLEIPS